MLKPKKWQLGGIRNYKEDKQQGNSKLFYKVLKNKKNIIESRMEIT